MWIVKRVYPFDLPIHNVDPIEDVIHTFYRLHIKQGCNIITLDDVLLQLNGLYHGQNTREKSKYHLPTCKLGHARTFKGDVLREGNP